MAVSCPVLRENRNIIPLMQSILALIITVNQLTYGRECRQEVRMAKETLVRQSEALRNVIKAKENLLRPLFYGLLE